MSVSLSAPPPVQDIERDELLANPAKWLQEETPWVVRGLVDHWPIVEKARQNAGLAGNYLKQFDRGNEASAFLCEAEHGGRFFYNDTLDGFNFVSVKTRLTQVIDKLGELAQDPAPAGLYVGSTQISQCLPGFDEQIPLALPLDNPLISLWLGNASRVAAHFDYPRNLACCVIGKRRFTVFPPEQLENLYIGPWDFTPAGQPISVVDFHQPDLERYPKFAAAWEQAKVAELEPGDAIYLPGMWWHHVEGLEAINGLVNYWWSETPSVYGNPADVFQHGLLSIKQLPPAQKRAWLAFFEHYLFADDQSHLSHIPPERRGHLGKVDSHMARQLRADLGNRLKR